MRVALFPCFAIILVAGCIGTAVSPPPKQTIERGDGLYVHAQIFDSTGKLLWSTRASDYRTLVNEQATAQTLFSVPLTAEDHPMRVDVPLDSRPQNIDNTSFVVLDALVGKPVGVVVSLPIDGHFEGFDTSVVLNRTRGPFAQTMWVFDEGLDQIAINRVGNSFSFVGVLPAQVISHRGNESQVQILAKDGAILALQQTNFTAEIHLVDSDQIVFRLDAEVNDTFSLLRSCAFARYVLPVGTYRVTSVDDAAIHLVASRTKWPQLIDKTDLTISIEVIEDNGHVKSL